jgi:phosphopantothenoylcysteine decarboxylase/phosphopantothenate--cysteine ligase
MFAAVKAHFGACDCLIMAAAVADYTPARPSKTKIKKADGRAGLTLQLKPTADILRWAGRHKSHGQIVVGFALEDKDLRAHAEKKLRDKHLDMIVANAPEAIGAKRSEVQVKAADGGWTTIRGAKATIAQRIIRLAEGR